MATGGLEAPPHHIGLPEDNPSDGGSHSITMSHGAGDSTRLAYAQYAWTESALTEIFFLIVTAFAVPVWVIRITGHLKRLAPSRADRFAPRDAGAANEIGPEPLLTEEQQDRRSDEDRRGCADHDAENDRQRETSQHFTAD
jgi:hypothetical protein